MLHGQRIIHGDNGTLRDLSAALNDIHETTSTLALVAAEDFVYIGSKLPFNHRHFYVASPNAAASVASVAIWDGSAWTAAVDVVDQTAVAGATLAQSGVISWRTERNASWSAAESTEDMTDSGLTSLKIYDMYWVRLAFSGNLTGSTALQYVGHRFADDADLAAYYPDLVRSSMLTAFATGKTTWAEQHYVAAEEIIRALGRRNTIWTPDQLLAWEELTLAAVHKVAENIFFAFGKDYTEQRVEARNRYLEELGQSLTVDEDEDGHEDEEETRRESITQGTMVRG
jgi:hypothetical protein